MDSDINDTSAAAAGGEKEVVYWEKPPKPFWGFWGTVGFGVIIFVITAVAQGIAFSCTYFPFSSPIRLSVPPGFPRC